MQALRTCKARLGAVSSASARPIQGTASACGINRRAPPRLQRVPRTEVTLRCSLGQPRHSGQQVPDQACRLADEALKKHTLEADAVFQHFQAMANKKASAVQQYEVAIGEKEHILRQLLRSNNSPSLDELELDEKTKNVDQQNERLMAIADEQDENLAQARQEASSAWEEARHHSSLWDAAEHEAEDAQYQTARVQQLMWDASKEVQGLKIPEILHNLKSGAMTPHEHFLAETLLKVLRVLNGPNGLVANSDASPLDSATEQDLYL